VGEVPRGVVKHAPHQLGFLGVQDRFDLDHAVAGVAPADVATLLVVSWLRLLTVALYERVLTAQLLQLRGGGETRVLEKQGFVRRSRDPHHRAHLRVRDFPAPEGIIDRGKLAEFLSDAHTVTRGDEVPAHSPCEPVRTRQCALGAPTTTHIELA